MDFLLASYSSFSFHSNIFFSLSPRQFFHRSFLISLNMDLWLQSHAAFPILLFTLFLSQIFVLSSLPSPSLTPFLLLYYTIRVIYVSLHLSIFNPRILFKFLMPLSSFLVSNNLSLSYVSFTSPKDFYHACLPSCHFHSSSYALLSFSKWLWASPQRNDEEVNAQESRLFTSLKFFSQVHSWEICRR